MTADPHGSRLESRDIWPKEVTAQPLTVKEALALVNTLKAGKSTDGLLFKLKLLIPIS